MGINGLLSLLGNAAAPAANTLAAHNEAATTERDKQRQVQLQQMALERQAKIDAQTKAFQDAQIGHFQAQSDALKEGQWGSAFNAADEHGNPVLVQQHKQTGDLRRAVLPPIASAPSQAGSAPRGANAPVSDIVGGNAGGRTSDMEEAQQGGAPQPAPQSPSVQSSRPASQGSALSPYVKPPVTPVPYRLTAPGMVADSTAAAKRAQAEAPYKKDPNAPPPSRFVFPVGADSAGKPVIYRGNTASGDLTPTGVGAKPAGGANAALEKEKTFADMLDSSLPTMEALSKKVRPAAITAATLHPEAGNVVLNKDEQAYLQSLRTFIAGTLHLESGARLSKEQWQIGLQRYAPTIGDADETVALKTAAARKVAADRRAQVNAATGGGRGGSAPPSAASPFADLIPKKPE